MVPEAEVVHALMCESAKLKGNYSPKDAIKFLWSMTGLQIEDAEMVRALSKTIKDSAGLLECDDISLCLWTLTHLQTQNGCLYSASHDASMAFYQPGNYQMVKCLHILASLETADRDLLRSLCAAIKQKFASQALWQVEEMLCYLQPAAPAEPEKIYETVDGSPILPPPGLEHLRGC